MVESPLGFRASILGCLQGQDFFEFGIQAFHDNADQFLGDQDTISLEGES